MKPKHNPTLPHGGWSRQSTRDPVALHLACAGLLLAVLCVLAFVALHS